MRVFRRTTSFTYFISEYNEDGIISTELRLGEILTIMEHDYCLEDDLRDYNMEELL